MSIDYIGMDVHKETISIAVMNGDGKLVLGGSVILLTVVSAPISSKPVSG